MRLVNYEVVRKDGSKFITTSYAEARNPAYVYIAGTFLTDIDLDDNAEKNAERLRKHREKVWAKIRNK